MRDGMIWKTAAAATFLATAPAAVAGPIAYQPQHVGAAELPAFTDMQARAASAAAAAERSDDVAGPVQNQVPAPAGFGIFALAAAALLGTRARRRRPG